MDFILGRSPFSAEELDAKAVDLLGELMNPVAFL